MPGQEPVHHHRLYIAFVIDETLRQVEAIDCPNVHRELERSLAESFEAWREPGPEQGDP